MTDMIVDANIGTGVKLASVVLWAGLDLSMPQTSNDNDADSRVDASIPFVCCTIFDFRTIRIV